MSNPIATVAYPYFECRDGIWEIDEFDLCDIFVVVGEERALVIDTGVGVGDIRWLIENKITDKPYDVVATHNHGDHIGGAGLFDKVYIHEDDIAEIDPAKAGDPAFAEHYCRLIMQREGKHYSYDINKDLTGWPKTPEFIPIKDGHKFDLGGRTVTCYHCPGHTKGEMVLIDDKTKTLLAGDACNCNWLLNVHLAPTGRECIEISCKAMERIYSMEGKVYDKNSVFNFHHDYRGFGQELDPETLPNLYKGMKSIVDGNAVYAEVKDPLSDCGGNRTVVKSGNVEIACMGANIREL